MAHVHPIYSWGYQGQRFADLQAFVEQTGAVVVDVRLKPFSRDPTWRRAALERALGEQYRWVEDLGNLNYRNGGPVRLKDEAAGLAIVRALASRRPLILMCVCVNLEHCHRKAVIECLAREHYIVRTLSLRAEVTRMAQCHLWAHTR